MEKKHNIATLIVATFVCLLVIFLHLLSHQKTQDIYLAQTEKVILDLRKDFLRDTVNNVFLEIDGLRASKYSSYQKNTEARLRRFQDELHLTDDQFIKFFNERFSEELSPGMWTAFLWRDDTGEVLHRSPDLPIGSTTSILEYLKSSLSSYAVVDKGNIKGVFGVGRSYIDQTIKNEAGDLIRSRRFSDDSYIWVNEVVNYSGGKDYAIRRIHPNLVDTEGMYLSTDMTDIMGNLPYLEELEGIKAHGELFSTYFFKELNSSDISEKLSYARLYADYDWIIAMGVHLDDIVAYTERVYAETNSLASEFIIRLVGYILAALLIGFAILFAIGQRQRVNSTKLLEKEMNLDTLTTAASRRCGEKNLANYFKQFRLTGEKPAIMMFDVDGFKQINDQYGHQVGDFVLVQVVKTVNQIIRNSDQLIRWGGDEFICIFPGLKEANVLELGEKLLDEISALEFPLGDATIRLTVSMGFSYFRSTDRDYTDALKRADDAMYRSKGEGKNRANVLF